jgi:pyruvate,orthophosphate dikinase
VTTEVFRYYPLFKKLPGALADFSRQLKRGIAEIEKRTERRFGDPENPLLMSVRSGAAISMPGMMSTIINVGITPEIAESLADRTGNIWFAWDNYRRFVQSWAMSMGLERDVFTELMRTHKEKCGVMEKRDFTGRQMRELALLYREKVIEMGVAIEDDPFQQLLTSIRLVLGSWDSEKAFAYRDIMEISDDWGTAVIVQAMSYGNLSKMAGTGVVFTANPKRKLDKVMLWGDYTTGNQGEDIVSGLVATNPISIEQSESMGIDPGQSMEKRFPDVYGELFALAKHLIYDKKWTPQEIEFTFEGPEAEQLHILQSRDMTTKKRQNVRVFEPSSGLDASYMSRGIGVSGGAMSGVVAFTLKDIQRLRHREPGKNIILIRADTVPDDIREISSADGILTARGGQTSHAAIVAFRLDKTCVVGCRQLVVNESDGYAVLGGKKIHYGDLLSIDGRNGAVYIGEHETTMEEESCYVI